MFREGSEYALTRGTSWNPFKRAYVLLKDYTFNFMDAEYTIPAGYEWDGPSGVPIIRWITEGWLEPSLKHDWLYENHFTLTKSHLFTRQDVDDQFFYDLSVRGVGWPTRFVVDKFYDRLFERFWVSAEPVKLSFTLVRDIIVALLFTAVFAFLLYKTQGALIGAFLGLFGG